MTLERNANMTLQGDTVRSLYRTIRNSGTIWFNNTNTLMVRGSGFIHNRPNGVLGFESGQMIFGIDATTNKILNEGSMIIMARSQVVTLKLPLISSGEIQLKSGSLYVEGDSSIASSISLEANTTVDFRDGVHQFSTLLEVPESSTLRLSGTNQFCCGINK